MFARFRMLALAGLAGAALLAPLPATAQENQEPLARFEDALCPGVLGLRQAAAEQMVSRMRDNAEAFGLRMAEEDDCEANFIVGFVEDGHLFLTGLQERRPYIFTEMPRVERDALLADPGPARALLRVRPRTRDGIPISLRENLVDLPKAEIWMSHSLIYSATRNDIIAATVLFDRERIRGLSLAQLADYATFRGLAHRLPGPEAAAKPSILSLFDSDGAERPTELTEFDRAYLGQLYSGLPNIPRPAKLADLALATGTDPGSVD